MHIQELLLLLNSARELCVDNALEVPLADKLLWRSLYSLGDTEQLNFLRAIKNC